MDAQSIAISILTLIIGLLAGLGYAHFAILKKINTVDNRVTGTEHDIKTVYTRLEGLEKRYERSVELATVIVNQNTLLMQQSRISGGPG